MRWRWLLLFFVSASSAHGADIGGWMEQKSRAELPRDDCPEIIALAARTPRDADSAGNAYYASGMCYLVSDKLARDSVAAGAWLARAAELDHPLARRALLNLRDASAPPLHPQGPHCHDLGLGRRLCH